MSGSEPREVLLEPGLSMYLPTGTPHAARAEDNVSLHVTIGINQLTWRMLLDRAVRDAMDGLDADDHLPAGYLDHPDDLATGLSQRLHSLRDGSPPRTPQLSRTPRHGPSWSPGTRTCADPWSTG